MSVIRSVMRSAKQKAVDTLAVPEWGYRLMLRIGNEATGPHGLPDAPWANAVLKDHDEVNASVEQARRLGLPVFPDLPKNWDTLAALDLILKNTGKTARILDAGGEVYSMILPWLYLYGYRNLVACNLAFGKPKRRGPVVYEPGDITATKYPDNHFDAVTCLSVIEHGVDLTAYFREMARITKPGGHLVTSTDYYEHPVDTRGQVSYGVPIHIFDRKQLTEAIEEAKSYGWQLTSPIDLSSDAKVVHWAAHDLRFTFATFSMQKVG